MTVVESTVEEKKETGISLELIGAIVLFSDFLVLFFLPAGLKLGQNLGFGLVLAAVAVVAFALVLCGHIMRVRADRA
ncbi:MAG: hypothetical protein ACRD3E_00460 [Terriglobales bacterium]